MVNLWDYADAKRLKITDKDGDEFVGYLVCIEDEEENESGTNEIVIQTNNDKIIGFTQNEVKNIEVLE